MVCWWAGWLPLGSASGEYWAVVGGWRLHYSVSLSSSRQVCHISSFHREAPTPGCANITEVLGPWGRVFSFLLWLIVELPHSSLFSFSALCLLRIQFFTINSLCFRYSEQFLFLWMKLKLEVKSLPRITAFNTLLCFLLGSKNVYSDYISSLNSLSLSNQNINESYCTYGLIYCLLHCENFIFSSNFKNIFNDYLIFSYKYYLFK